MSKNMEGTRVDLTMSPKIVAILVALILILIGSAIFLGPGWLILIALALMPVIIIRSLAEEQWVIATKKLVQQLQSKQDSK
jgi:hypothetical protein